MLFELDKLNLKVESEKALEVYYDDQVVGNFYIDLYVEEKIVVELKSVQKLLKEHEVQLVNYLNGLKKEIGLLINFGPSGVEIEREYSTALQNLQSDPLPKADCCFSVSSGN